MKALWAAGAPKEMNNTMLLNYLTVGYTSDPTRPYDTFYDEINTMPPGHFMLLKMLPPTDILNFEFEVFSYWDLDKETQVVMTEKEASEKFAYLFQTSVKRRLRSDVPIGTSLSGGLDSSSIVATANKFLAENSNYQQASFSAVFPGFEKDESRQIQSIAQKFRLKSHLITPTANGLIHDFQKLQYHQEEPFQSSSIYAQYKVYELAKEHGVTVLLDGQGADETLAGYHKYYHWYWQELIRNSKFKIQNEESKKATQLGVNVLWGFQNYVAAFFPNQASKALARKAYKSQKHHPALASDFLKAYKDETSLDKPVVEKLNDILYYNTMQHGLQELLRYADRNSMAHSREVRLPFLNHELVQFIFSLPSYFKIKDGFTKWILRQAMHQQLPNEITWRKDKVGFEPPQQLWMQNKQMQDYIHESKKKLVKKGILRKDVLDKVIVPQPAHEPGNYDWRYLSAAHCL
jgi:asparagine synthase (glutamine-hydrolysing)